MCQADGSSDGAVQIQCIDDQSMHDVNFAIPKLQSEHDAFRIVKNGKMPHHMTARAILYRLNPQEYLRVTTA